MLNFDWLINCPIITVKPVIITIRIVSNFIGVLIGLFFTDYSMGL